MGDKMRLIIEHNENISLFESVGIAYAFINRIGLDEIVEDCKQSKGGIGQIDVRGFANDVVVKWAQLNGDDLTIHVFKERCEK